MDTPDSGTGLTEAKRRRLGELADALIAGGAGMPSASQADAHRTWMDRALAARPDLALVVIEVASSEGPAKQSLDDLRQRDRARFDAFAFAVSGAYLINPRVRKLLGFPGPIPAKAPAFPDEAESYLEDGILDVVLNRGPIYRPTPQG